MSAGGRVSIDVERAAEAIGLGAVRASLRAFHRVHAPGEVERAKRAELRNGLLVLGAAAVPLLTLGLVWWATGNVGTAIVVALLVLAVGGGGLAVPATKGSTGSPSPVHLFTGGFVLSDSASGAVRAFRWDDFPAVHRSVTTMYVNGRDIGTTYSFRLVGEDGKNVVVHGLEQPDKPLATDIVELGPLLEEEVVNRRLPLAVAEIDAGGAARFGDLAVSAAGIGTPEGFLPWAALGELPVRAGHLLVGAAGGRAARYPVGDIPNFPLLLVLARNLRTR